MGGVQGAAVRVSIRSDRRLQKGVVLLRKVNEGGFVLFPRELSVSVGGFFFIIIFSLMLDAYR